MNVIEELKWEPTISSININVVTNNGVVTLSGTVPHYAEKSAAERATQRVEGVKAIAEELEVHTIAIRNDSEIAQAVVNTLEWHCVGAEANPGNRRGWLGDALGLCPIGIPAHLRQGQREPSVWGQEGFPTTSRLHRVPSRLRLRIRSRRL